MKRSFRVATVFTGAAACAAALMPAAEAAPVTPGASARLTPNTTARTCGQTNHYTNSVHLYYSSRESHPLPACITGIRNVYIGTGKRFSYYCGGAFSGSLEISGTFRHFTAGVRHHNLYKVYVSDVYI